MNAHEAQRIARCINTLRPDWPIASLLTLLDRDDLKHRPRRDVLVALGWVACESESLTPARVLEAGPWWRAAAVEDGHVRETGPFCVHCSKPQPRCEQQPNRDHEFAGPDDWMRRRSTAAESARTAARAAVELARHEAQAAKGADSDTEDAA